MIQCVMDSLGISAGEVASPQPKKSWQELKEQVCDIRRQVSIESIALPSCLNFRTLPDGRERIYFLSAPNNGWEMTLLYVDVPLLENVNTLKWHPLIETSMLSGSVGRMSREEQLQWERKRLSSWGITSYEMHPNTGRIVFPALSKLYHCVDPGLNGGLVLPSELRSGPSGAKLSPQICPCNSSLVAYVNENDIYVTVMTSSSPGLTQRLTFSYVGPEEPIMAGNPSYVMQEEFNRYVGFWWQPTSSADTYRILFEEVDETEVGLLSFPGGVWGESEELRFPRAGSNNATSQLKIIEFRVSEMEGVTAVRILTLPCTIKELFPWAEYMVRAGWTPKGHHVWLSVLDRRQTRLDVCLLDPSEFVDLIDCDATETGASWRPTVHTVHTQCSDVWINIHDIIVFVPYEKNASSISLVTASEVTGYRHLYLTHYNLNSLPQSPGAESIALTSGDWPVLGKSVWFDETRQLVYFLGLRETPLEKHLYVVSLRKPNHIRLLTLPGSSYNAYFNQDCSLCVLCYSNTHTVPACQVIRVVHTDWSVDGVSLVPAGYLLEPRPALAQYRPDIYSHVISSGDTLYAMVLKPHDYEPGRKYPTVLHVYGGPEVQLVTNTYKGMRTLRMHMLAARGYCVLSIDSRGSQHRGLQFEAHIKGKMGSVELSDQVEVLLHLAQKLGCIDLTRVGIHGWSYGGYLSLMALVQYPQVFKLSIAGAPVTCWNLYDTGYTERYMDLPDLNPAGYTQGSVLTHVSQFPDEENRLLIIHGLIDENVHFYHTSELINTLVREGKPYQLQVYPSERHSLRNMDASKHYETVLLSFLQNHL